MKTHDDLEGAIGQETLDGGEWGVVGAVEVALTYCLCFVPNLFLSLMAGIFIGVKQTSFWWGVLCFVFCFCLLFVPSCHFAERKIKS